MKRLITAICFLVFLISISVTSIILLHKTTNELTEQLMSACEYAQKGDTETAMQLTEDFSHKWKDKQPLLVAVIRTTPLEEITSDIASLTTYLEYDEIPHFCAEAKKVAAGIQYIWDTEKPTFSNIL